jgi:hypothetical protein
MKAVVRRRVLPEILKRCGAATFYLSNATSKSRRSLLMKPTLLDWCEETLKPRSTRELRGAFGES